MTDSDDAEFSRAVAEATRGALEAYPSREIPENLTKKELVELYDKIEVQNRRGFWKQIGERTGMTNRQAYKHFYNVYMKAKYEELSKSEKTRIRDDLVSNWAKYRLLGDRPVDVANQLLNKWRPRLNVFHKQLISYIDQNVRRIWREEQEDRKPHRTRGRRVSDEAPKNDDFQADPSAAPPETDVFSVIGRTFEHVCGPRELVRSEPLAQMSGLIEQVARMSEQAKSE